MARRPARAPVVETHTLLTRPRRGRAVLTFQIRKRGNRRIDVQPEFTRVGDDVTIGSTQW